MSTDASPRESRTARPGATQLRIWLLVLATPALLAGVWAVFAPASWYSDFGASASPSAFGPYNEHFVQDIGGGYLAFGAALLWAAKGLRRSAIRAALVATLAFTLPHLVIHLIEAGDLSTGGYLFVNGGLLFGVAAALWAWRLSARVD